MTEEALSKNPELEEALSGLKVQIENYITKPTIPLDKDNLPGRIINVFIMMTMLFNEGIIVRDELQVGINRVNQAIAGVLPDINGSIKLITKEINKKPKQVIEFVADEDKVE